MLRKAKQYYKTILDLIETAQLALCTVLLIAIVSNGALEIFRRFLLDSPMAWAHETNILLASWLYFLGFPIIAKHGEYIVVEYFAQYLPSTMRKFLAIAIPIFVIGFCLIVAVYGIQLQSIHRKLLVSGLPVNRNWYSLPVVICAASLAFISIYDLWCTIEDLFRSKGTD